MNGAPAFDSLDRLLVDAVPELKAQHDGLLREWGTEAPGPHVVFGDVLNPYLLELLATEASAAIHASALRRVFAFLERLARDGDDPVRAVVAATVCERLGDNPVTLALGRRFMGPATRRLSDEIETFWGATEGSNARGHPVGTTGA